MRGLRIGLSDYTLAWPGNQQWIDRVLADPDLRGAVLDHWLVEVADGAIASCDLPHAPLCIRAYPVCDGRADGSASINLDLAKALRWVAPAGTWRVVAVWARPVEHSVDPLHPNLGRRVIDEHFHRFADRLPAELIGSLDYFFQDELMFGLGNGRPWSRYLPAAFRARHGYDLLDELPALVTDLGPRTVKVRLDTADVVTHLGVEGYFKPIYQWHADRGMTYGCDQMGRGLV